MWTYSFRHWRIPGSLFFSFMFTVYVIKSVEGLRYIGQTQDLPKRLREHNSHMDYWTNRGNNWKLVYCEEYATRSEAMKREKFLKTGKGRDFLDTVSVERNVDL